MQDMEHERKWLEALRLSQEQLAECTKSHQKRNAEVERLVDVLEEIVRLARSVLEPQDEIRERTLDSIREDVRFFTGQYSSHAPHKTKP